jgi:hypothetical protein
MQTPRVGGIDWGDFDRTQPINANWGYERGTPIDRYYIDQFLQEHASDIRGRVLEVANNEYTRKNTPATFVAGCSRWQTMNTREFSAANA